MFGWFRRSRAAPAPPAPARYRHLTVGQRYRVAQPFDDFTGRTHPTDEISTFVSWNYLPYDDVLTLFFERDDGSQVVIQLQDRPEAQREVVDALDSYLVAAD